MCIYFSTKPNVLSTSSRHSFIMNVKITNITKKTQNDWLSSFQYHEFYNSHLYIRNNGHTLKSQRKNPQEILTIFSWNWNFWKNDDSDMIFKFLAVSNFLSDILKKYLKYVKREINPTQHKLRVTGTSVYTMQKLYIEKRN